MSAVLLSLAYQSLWQDAIAAQPRRDISATADPRKPPEVESNLRRSLVRLQDDGGRHDIDPKAKLVEVLKRTSGVSRGIFVQDSAPVQYSVENN